MNNKNETIGMKIKVDILFNKLDLANEEKRRIMESMESDILDLIINKYDKTLEFIGGTGEWIYGEKIKEE